MAPAVKLEATSVKQKMSVKKCHFFTSYFLLPTLLQATGYTPSLCTILWTLLFRLLPNSGEFIMDSSSVF